MSLFVTLEGIEGSGKSTLRSRLTDSISRNTIEVVSTREPGATPLGRQIRSLLLDPDLPPFCSLSELLLFSADRAQHLDEVIRPALQRNALVLCDRYVHSTIAYQGYGRGVSLEILERLNEITTEGLLPDLVLLLDLDPASGLARAKARAERASGNILTSAQGEASWTRFEEETLSFHQRVRAGFLELAKSFPQMFVIIDASKSPEAITEEAMTEITRRLEARTA